MFTPSHTRIYLQLYVVCEYYTYQTTALLPGIFLSLFEAAYELRLASYGLETVSKIAACSFVDFWGICSIIPGVARIVKPHPDYCACNRE